VCVWSLNYANTQVAANAEEAKVRKSKEKRAKQAAQKREKNAAEDARRAHEEARKTVTATHRDPSDDLVADLVAQLTAERAACVAAETKLVKAEKAPCVVCLDQDRSTVSRPHVPMR
jgi:sRNA-binding protein